MEGHMNIFDLVLGIVIFGYGIFSFILRIKSPGKFGKLEEMKKQFGNKGGMTIHIIFYSILPILGGIVFILSGILGVGIF